MKIEELAALNDEQLLEEAKKAKKNFTVFCFFVGLLAGVAIFSFLRKGFTVSTILPIIFIGIFAKNGKDYKDIKNLLKERNLEQR
jgi:hypothetical protein